MLFLLLKTNIKCLLPLLRLYGFYEVIKTTKKEERYRSDILRKFSGGTAVLV